MEDKTSSSPSRLSFDEVFDLIAISMACRGTCNRLRTATIIRDKQNRLIASGYNGSLPGDPHCDDVGHLIVDNHCLRTTHGEINAIKNCLDLAKIEGGTVTVVGNPCFTCAREIASFRPDRIRYIGEYDNSIGKEHVEELCRSRGIKIEHIPVDHAVAAIQKAVVFLQGPGGPLKDLPKIDIMFREQNMDENKTSNKPEVA